jgi:hypothetical protein
VVRTTSPVAPSLRMRTFIGRGQDLRADDGRQRADGRGPRSDD